MRSRTPSTPPELPGFTYVSLLGLGGFADVFKYEDSLGRQVAVKVLLRDNAVSGEASFGAEANLMAKLSNHPSIVSVHQAGIAADGRPFLVMEHCPPPHLSARLRTKPLTVAQALVYGVQLAGAVETAHRLGILHRDIKPANILFTEYGRPALTDFGISVPTGADGIGTGAGVSIAWAPPEQLVRGAAMGRSGDVYSLAATVYHMLAGRSPFQRGAGASNDSYDLIRRVQGDPVPPIGRPEVPESLERVLDTAMAKSPTLRYQTALDFARALQAIQIELHQSPTAIEARDEAAATADDADDEDAGGTRLEGFVLIDPDGPGGTLTHGPGTSTGGPITVDTAGGSPGQIIHHGRGRADPVEPIEWTSHTAYPGDAPVRPDAVPAQGPGTVTPPRRSRSKVLLWTAVGACAVAVAAVAVVFAVQALDGAGTSPNDGAAAARSSVSQAPADPVGAFVPMPADGVGVLAGDSVTFRWTNPDPKTGDTFLYRIDDPANPGGFTMGTDPQAVVASQPGRTCIEVVLRRSGGKGSEPAVFCVPPAVTDSAVGTP